MKRTWILIPAITLLVASCGGSEPSSQMSAPPDDAAGVVGTSTCTITKLGEEADGGILVITDRAECAYDMSDPRVSGTEVFELVIRYDPEMPGSTWTSQAVLETGEGTWRGTGQGITDLKIGVLPTARGVYPYNAGVVTYVGEGSYEGLVYRLYVSGLNGEYANVGWISGSS